MWMLPRQNLHSSHIPITNLEGAGTELCRVDTISVPSIMQECILASALGSSNAPFGETLYASKTKSSRTVRNIHEEEMTMEGTESCVRSEECENMASSCREEYFSNSCIQGMEAINGSGKPHARNPRSLVTLRGNGDTERKTSQFLLRP